MIETHKHSSDSVYIIFPCYNEEEGLEKLLLRVKNVSKISKQNFKLVIVNDGSTDHTAHVAQAFNDELPIHLIDFRTNKGVAEVFNTAFNYVLTEAQDNDIIITIDSDNTMNPYTILDLLDKISQADIVIASRFIKHGRMVGAGYRILLSYMASWLMRFKIGIPNVTDYSIFFRAYRAYKLREVFSLHEGHPVSGHGFSCMANLLIRIYAMNKATIFTEVPLVLRYDKKEGGSAIKIFRTIWGYLMLSFSCEKNRSEKS